VAFKDNCRREKHKIVRGKKTKNKDKQTETNQRRKLTGSTGVES
jgi:hypothetical protein